MLIINETHPNYMYRQNIDRPHPTCTMENSSYMDLLTGDDIGVDGKGLWNDDDLDWDREWADCSLRDDEEEEKERMKKEREEKEREKKERKEREERIDFSNHGATMPGKQ
jgi:hypothetical protein